MHLCTQVNFLAVVILVDAAMALIDTDYRAMDREPPLYTQVMSHFCLSIYTIEIVAGVYMFGPAVLKRTATIFDTWTGPCGPVGWGKLKDDKFSCRVLASNTVDQKQ